MTICCAAAGGMLPSSEYNTVMPGPSLWRRSAQPLKATPEFPPHRPGSIALAGDTKSFPVRRIWCVGRNYLEHIREMGNDERAPPFFFAKHPDMLEPDGAPIPYPPLTKDLHHEVELIVAMKRGGLNIPAD